MSTRSMLVYYPGYPFDWGALTPQRAAAAAAGALIEAGHECMVRDFGTLNTLERLTPPDSRSVAGPLAERVRAADPTTPFRALPNFLEVARMNAKFRKLQRRHCAELGAAFAKDKKLRFIGFLVQSPDDAHCVNRIAATIKANTSDRPLVAFGSFVEEHGPELRRAMPHIDWFCAVKPEYGLPQFAAVAHDRSKWDDLPGASTETQSSQDIWHGPFASAAAPVYDPALYPVIEGSEKLLIFEVEDSYADPTAQHALRLRPVEDVCNHIWELRAQFGAGLVRFTGHSTPALHMRGILNGLARRNVDILYSRRLAAASADAGFAEIEFASGCVVQTHEVFTGSQRLHDRFYRTGSTITQMETVLRASREAGIETIAELTYPCPADDYHTRDETMRLIRRTKPDAALVRLPNVAASHRWFHEAKRHGFEIPRNGLAARATAKCMAMYPLARHQWDRPAYGMRGRGPSQIQTELDAIRAEMAELGVHPFDGEIASLVRAAASAISGRHEPVPVYTDRPFVELDSFASAVDSCRGIAAASRENVQRAASAGLRPVAGDG